MDFRDYLDLLERSGQLLKVKKSIAPRFEIAAGLRKSCDMAGPALFFENIKGYPGWRVAGGLYGTQMLMALALGLPAETDEPGILKRYLEFDQQRIKPRLVSSGPVKDIVLKGKDIDLNKLPIPVYSELDSGPYLTAGVEIGRSRRTGVQNASMHRRQIVGKNRTAILAGGYQHLGKLIREAEADGQGLQIATVIGAPTELTIACQIDAPEGVDEAEIAGAIRGAPLKFVKCETIDVEVPADAEIIIEGITVPGEKVVDGPFGEFPGNYITLLNETQSRVPVIEVTAITMRRDPIFQAMLTGAPMTDNHYLKKWALAAAAYRAISDVADIRGINCTVGGAAAYHLVVAINKQNGSDPQAIVNALTAARRSPKLLIIVDDDINIYNPIDVEWAIATRVKADKDIAILPSITPSSDSAGNVVRRFAVCCIDATVPVAQKKWYQRICIPGSNEVDYL